MDYPFTVGNYEFLDSAAAFREAKRRIKAVVASGGSQLDLQNLGLTSLPESIGDAKSVRSLWLQNNLLEALPPSIRRVAGLKVLSLWWNRLKTVPNEIGHLANLEQLDLSDNNLVMLSPSLGNLSRLKSIDLSGNEALALPPEVLRGSPASILDYYSRTRAGSRPLNEAKLILVGRSRADQRTPSVAGDYSLGFRTDPFRSGTTQA
jgi:Leucine-rich repeat (LRR) protein